MQGSAYWVSLSAEDTQRKERKDGNGRSDRNERKSEISNARKNGWGYGSPENECVERYVREGRGYEYLGGEKWRPLGVA